MDAAMIRGLKAKRTRFLGRFAECFERADTRAHLPVSVEGQLSDLSEKRCLFSALSRASCEEISEDAAEGVAEVGKCVEGFVLARL